VALLWGFFSRAAAIDAVKAACATGKSVAELCELGDNTINEKLASVYKGKKIEKGIAFPTCISVSIPLLPMHGDLPPSSPCF
jgi:hypothetical protein